MVGFLREETEECGRQIEEVLLPPGGEIPKGEATGCYKKDTVSKTERGEAVEEMEQRREASRSEQMKKPVEEGTYDIKASKQLGKLPRGTIVSEEEDIPLRPQKQTETGRSPCCPGDLPSLPSRQAPPAVSSALTKEREAEERRMVVLHDPDKNNCHDKQLEPTHESRRGQVTVIESWISMLGPNSALSGKGEPLGSYRGKKPGTDNIYPSTSTTPMFDMPEGNQKPDKQETSAPGPQCSTTEGTRKSDSGQMSDPNASLKSPADTGRSDTDQKPDDVAMTSSSTARPPRLNTPAQAGSSASGQKSETGAMSLTPPCASSPATPAETESSSHKRKTRKTSADDDLLPDCLPPEPQETEKTEEAKRQGPVFDELPDCLPTELQETEKAKRQGPVFDELPDCLPTELQEREKTEEAKRLRSVSDEDSNKSSIRPPQLRRNTGPGRKRAIALSFLVFALMMSFAGGLSCVGRTGKMVDMEMHRGEVGVVCPVTTNLHKTLQSLTLVNIIHDRAPQEVLKCDWELGLQKFECQPSDYEAELVAIRNDTVLIKLPDGRAQQEEGYYTCRLTPANLRQYFPKCGICHPADPTTTTTTTTPTSTSAVRVGTGSSTSGHPQPDDPHTRPDQTDAPSADPGGLETAVVFLSITVFVLVLCLIGLGILYLKREMRRDGMTNTAPASSPLKRERSVYTFGYCGGRGKQEENIEDTRDLNIRLTDND